MSEKPSCYFRSKNKVIGPITTAALQQLVEQGRVIPKPLIQRLRDSGHSLRQIANELTERGIPTKAGNTDWIHTSVSRILKRAA